MMPTRQAKQMSKELGVTSSALSLDILERFMAKEELRSVLQDYSRAKRTTGTGSQSRFVFLSEPITEEERSAMRVYLDENIGSVNTYEKTRRLKKSSMQKLYLRFLRKWAYQNQSKLDL